MESPSAEVLGYIQRCSEVGVGFLLGLWLGHRLSLGRDKRKEYAAVADPIRSRLQSLAGGHIGAGRLPLPSAHEMGSLRFYLGRKRWRRLQQAVKNCAAEAEKQRVLRPGSAWNEMILADEAAVRAAILRVVAELPRL